MNILFVCRHNLFRSRVAEARFNQLNKNPNLKAKSAGLFPGNVKAEHHIIRLEICDELGLNIHGPTKPVTTKLLKWQDVIVVVADDVPGEVFEAHWHKNDIRVLKTKDCHSIVKKDMKAATKRVIRDVDKFIRSLN